LPELPTVAEVALPGFEAINWFGILVPAKTPRAIVERLHREITLILRSPEMKERLAGEGAELVGNTPEEFGAYIRSEMEKWAKVAKEARIPPQ
jgi:tripartite-type tricarboxylate transporter receptor subunit TctC